MSKNTRWLAICDDYDNPKIPGNDDPAAVVIREYLPETLQGSVLVTTRSSHFEMGLSMPIRKLARAEERVPVLSSMSRSSLSTRGKNVLISFGGD